jgi:hypothetical protein
MDRDIPEVVWTAVRMCLPPIVAVVRKARRPTPVQGTHFEGNLSAEALGRAFFAG